MTEVNNSKSLLRKESGYYALQRLEMLSFVPMTVQRVLDVGCGIGMFGEALKRRGPCQVDGVEIMPQKAAEARLNLDSVWTGDFADDLSLPIASYDCIVFNDVLEHMIDPGAALQKARGLLNPQGCVVTSIPNVRHFPIVWKLAIQGRWDYADSGILDRTHLRFFTRSTLLRLFFDAGYSIENIVGINRYAVNGPDENRLWRYQKILNLISPRHFRDMAYLQFAVVAVPLI